jgi:O-antigen/teichoic acid export membrane protein
VNLFKNVVIYGISNAWSSGVSYFLILFLTLYISPEGIGKITNFQYLGNLLLPLIGLSSIASMNREFFNKEINFKELLWQVAYLMLITVLVLLVLGFFIGDVVADYTALPIEYVGTALLFAFFFQTVETRLTVFRLRDKAKEFGLWKLGRGFLEIGITVGAIYLISETWEWRIAAFIIANGILFLIVLFKFLKGEFFTLNKELIRQILNYSLPLVPNALMAVAIGFTDKLFITNYLGIGANGVYSVAFQLGMIVALLQNSFNQAWAPWFYGEMGKQTINYSQILKYSLAFIGLFFIVCLGIVLLAPVLLNWLNKEFLAPLEVVVFIMSAFFFNGVYKVFVNYLFFYRKTRLILIITASSAVLNIVLNAILVPSQGMIGAALATMFSFLFQMILTATIVQWKYKLPWITIFKK